MTLDTRLTIEEWKQVAEAVKSLQLGQKNDPASTTLTASPPYAPFPGNEDQFGMFTYAGVRPQRWSPVPTPHSLASILGVGEKSIYWQELLEVMTGVTADAGTNATGFCGNPPTVGQGKVCQQVYKWGKYYVKTDLNALPDIGQVKNRSVLPAEILNPPVDRRNPFIPDLFYQWDGEQSALRYDLWRIGKSLEKSWEKVAITGDDTQASASTEHGWIVEFDGLDGQIKTGYTDIPTGLACPAMDSIVKSFNAEVSSTDANGDNIVQALTDVYWALKDRSTEFGMPGAVHACVMRKELFRALVEIWACNYATYRCSGSASLPVNQDATETNRLRIDMLKGQYLIIDGDICPVVFSEGIVRDGLGLNHFKSDLYCVPVTWEGLRLLRLEYFPMDNAELREFASFVDDDVIALNNGLFLAGTRSTGMCKEYHFAAKMRLILETPFLAGRVDDIRFTFRADIRNADPSDTYFYADGGRSYRS